MLHIVRIVLLMTAFALAAVPCGAKVYKYQKDGVWYFTDAPPREMLKKSKVMEGSESGAPPPSPEGTPLLEDYPAKNAIEKAAAATVAVKGGLGYGSGFFITKDGYILTNKHVIRTSKDQEQYEKGFFDEVDSGIKDAEKEMAAEKKRLEKQAAKLKELKHLAADEDDPSRKKSYEDEYEYRLKVYQDEKEDFEKGRKQFQSQKKQYLSKRSDYKYSQLVANLSQSFEIILADNTRVNARLVATSKNQDLALLKLDGYKTPALKALKMELLMLGFPLYAIGNPARLKNSVTKGIWSGFERGYIKTNAQIYPGNSGGPLVTKEGQVIGINTFKELTHKYEGLGFAIPIGKALSEFSKYLP